VYIIKNESLLSFLAWAQEMFLFLFLLSPTLSILYPVILKQILATTEKIMSKAGGVTQEVEHLPRKCEALSVNSSSAKT
jgi:hypothetical protein